MDRLVEQKHWYAAGKPPSVNNNDVSGHIVIIADPIEFIHTPKKCIVRHRERLQRCEFASTTENTERFETPYCNAQVRAISGGLVAWLSHCLE